MSPRSAAGGPSAPRLRSCRRSARMAPCEYAGIRNRDLDSGFPDLCRLRLPGALLSIASSPFHARLTRSTRSSHQRAQWLYCSLPLAHQPVPPARSLTAVLGHLWCLCLRFQMFNSTGSYAQLQKYPAIEFALRRASCRLRHRALIRPLMMIVGLYSHPRQGCQAAGPMVARPPSRGPAHAGRCNR